MGWDFDIHSDPQGGKFDSTAILKSREDLGMSDEWCAILENTQNLSERVSCVHGCQRVLCCFIFKQKCCFFMPISALSLKKDMCFFVSGSG